jgi:predicted nucleotide-binding protein (sugar kinase/HSP70/actin superfamily)
MEVKNSRKALQQQAPNLVKTEAKRLFEPMRRAWNYPDKQTQVTSQQVQVTLGGWGPTLRKKVTRDFVISSPQAKARRTQCKIAIPQVLNVYSLAPFIRAYLEALGIDPKHIYFSGYSNEDMYLEGAKYGSVDSCYPAKVAQSHVYALLHDKKYLRRGLDHIWFPAMTHLSGYLEHTMGQTACPIVTGTPKVVWSAFTKERDLFAERGVGYVDTALNFDDPILLKSQLFDTWRERLEISEDENSWAVDQAWQAQREHDNTMEAEGKAILDQAEQEGSVVLLLLGRPYHSDPGINHEVLDAFQSLGFNTLSMRAIPKDPTYLERFFAEDIQHRIIASAFDIRDVWAENFSTNSAQKVWAAKFAARHPNVAVVDLSSFKCGHDAPTYAIIDKILGASRTPHLTLHDIDANKPGGSIKIRVKTFAYTLEQYAREIKDTK